MDVPLGISKDRVILYGSALFIIGFWQLLLATLHDRSLADWSDFWTGGATVGGRALLDPQLHFSFQASHGFQNGIWPYLPAFALLFAPAAHLPITVSYAINVIVMLAAAALAGLVLADAFLMPRWFGLVLALSWPPVKIAAIGGQNTPLALLLVAVAILAARKGSCATLGIAIGLLLYKPSIAVPFILVLLARREWRALLIVAVFAGCWYLLSVPAAGGDWLWPKIYSRTLLEYYRPDFLSNARNAVSLPGLLMNLGLSALAATAVGGAVLLACLPRLRKINTLDSLAAASVLAIVASPHAWYYEPVVMLPVLFWAMRMLPPATATWLTVASYVIAEVSIFPLPWVWWNVQLLIVLGWTAIVVLVLYSVGPKSLGRFGRAQPG